MYVRSSGLPVRAAWYVSRLSIRSPYSTSSGAAPRPARHMRCRRRASSSWGWNGVRQKSSNRSSRSPSSPSCAPETRSSSGSSTASRLRSVRHSENATSGSSSATMIAPDHPSAGSSAAAIAPFETAFHANPPRPSVCARSAGAGSGKTSSGSPPGFMSERLEIAGELPRRDLLLVRVPLPPLVTDEVVEDVLPERLVHEGRAFHDVERFGERLREGLDPGGGTGRGRHLEDVVRRLVGEGVALLDPLHPGREHHRERKVGVARRVG